MARNRSRKKKNKPSNGNHDILGVGLIIVSAFLLLCIVIKPILGVFSEAIFGVMLGVFGIASYPMLIATLTLGIFILLGRKIEAEVKTRVGIALAVIFALVILQLASTHAFLGQKFSAYMSSTYSAKYSAGGVIMGLIAFAFKAVITEAATYVVFSLAFILDILFMTSAFKKLRALIGKRKDKTVMEEPPVEEPDEPASPQLVVDATPPHGLFTDKIEPRLPEINVDAGSSSDIPVGTQRKVSDYAGTPVFEDEDEPADRSALTAAARKQLYSDKEEIKRRAAEEFRAANAQPQAEQSQTQTQTQPHQPIQQQYVYAEPAQPVTPLEYMDPAERVVSDAQNADRPRRVDYDGTPNNLNALYFPPDKNIHFNDVGIENIVDEHPKKQDRPTTPREPIYDGSDNYRPAFGMPKTNQRLEYVEPIDPIIDASQPMTPPVRPIEPVQPVRSAPPISYATPQYAPEPEPASVDDKFMRALEDMDRPKLNDITDGSVQTYVPPLETDKFKEEIFDATDALNPFAGQGSGEIQQQEEILDGSKPYEPEFGAQSDIEELRPDVGDESDDDGIIDGSLVISNEPAIDLSERHFDNGDGFTGQDLSGMYVAADDQDKPVVEAVKPKIKKSNAPLENQMTIQGVLQQQAEQSVVSQDTKRYKHYNYKTPPYDLLKIYDAVDASQEELQANAEILEDVVSRFLKTQVSVINIVPGPQVTRYELDVPKGTSVKAIETRCADIAYELAAVSGVRVEAPIPGKRAVGIEVPNKKKAIVGLREVVSSQVFTKHKSPMLFSVGKDIGGELVVCDLEKIPHLLIAGQTGSGKSAGLNSLIVSLLYKSSPEDLRFILIDPKRVEFSKFRGMPHLLFEKTITEPGEALNALKWADKEMNRRYTVLQKYACSKLSEYNGMPDVVNGKLSRMPHIVIIIDELANLMQSSVSGEIESKISSIAALARAAGIHLIVATQRPSADVITGTIKANLTSRIAFKVPDATNSRIIIDVTGAEALTGDGDMLFYPQDAYAPKRVQGSFVGGEEVLSVVSHLKENYECDFDEEAEKYVAGGNGGAGGGDGDGGGEMDPLAPRVMAHAIKAKQISTTVVQRRFSIGYARAARIIDNLETAGYIGPMIGNNKPRDVNMTVEQYKELFGHELDDN
ncbi:MAG: hypothetical protein K2F90_00595 [Clostridiales bacterium]|nr:hypothetical protein [Clostridiales bacterium]